MVISRLYHEAHYLRQIRRDRDAGSGGTCRREARAAGGYFSTARHFTLVSGTAIHTFAPQGLGDQLARARRRLSPEPQNKRKHKKNKTQNHRRKDRYHALSW